MGPSEAFFDFDVVLHRQSSEKLGVSLTGSRIEQTIVIADVKPQGLVAEWNSLNPNRQFRPDDVIVCANGIAFGQDRMRGEVTGFKGELQLSLRRRVPLETLSQWSTEEAIKHAPAPSTLQLSQRQLDEGVIEAVATILEKTSIVERLLIDQAGLGDAGAFRLADGLLASDSLIYANLSYNGIFDEGGARIADALERNSSLRDLDVNQNYFSESIAERIRLAVASKKRITKVFTLSGEKLDSKMAKLTCWSIHGVGTDLGTFSLQEPVSSLELALSNIHGCAVCLVTTGARRLSSSDEVSTIF